MGKDAEKTAAQPGQEGQEEETISNSSSSKERSHRAQGGGGRDDPGGPAGLRGGLGRRASLSMNALRRRSSAFGFRSSRVADAEGSKAAALFQIDAFPEEFRKTAEKFDLDRSGTLDQQEMAAALVQFQGQESLISHQRKQIFALSVAGIALMCIVFGLSLLSAILAKDFTPDETGDGTLRTGDGTVVRCGASDYDVVGGSMVMRSRSDGVTPALSMRSGPSPSSGRRRTSTSSQGSVSPPFVPGTATALDLLPSDRLREAARRGQLVLREGRRLQTAGEAEEPGEQAYSPGAVPLATRTIQQKSSLSSTMPDEYFETLTDVTIKGRVVGTLYNEFNEAISVKVQ